MKQTSPYIFFKMQFLLWTLYVCGWLVWWWDAAIFSVSMICSCYYLDLILQNYSKNTMNIKILQIF